MIERLEPPVPVYTPKGAGYAFILIDYGFENDLIWVVGMDDSGEVWCVPNKEIRLQENWTAGRRK